MCGITGWLDFDRAPAGRRAIAQAMTDTMSCRGPDAEGLVLDGPVALGHRRLAVIDVAGGRQPMTVDEDGHALAVISYSGEVYNFTELRTELQGYGHRFRTRSDTEVVLRAYVQWGEEFVHRLNGMYAFAVWDVRRQELLLVRDRLGVKPLYYQRLPHGVLFGSEPKAILAHPDASRAVDEDGLRELLAMAKTPERSVYRDVHEVRPGHLVRVGRTGLTRRRYWALEAREHSDDLDTTVRTVRDLVDDSVRRQTVSDVPLCAQLSGGLDSSVVTAFAARALHERGDGPLRSFTVDFTGYGEMFTPNLIAETRDLPFAHDLARHAGTEHRDIVLDTAELTDAHARAAVLRATDVPNGSGDFNTSLYLLFRAIRQHSTVALSGESADEIFGGYPWMFHPEAVQADTFPWLAFLHNEHALSGLLDEGLLKRLDLSGYRRERYAEALAEAPRLAGETGFDQRMRAVSYVHLTRFLQAMLDRKDRMSMAVGLEVRVPFCDHRLVEYAFNVPWAMKTFDGHEKSLLRAAGRELLPDSVLQRRKVVYPTVQDPAYEHTLRAEFAAMLADPQAPVLALLNVDAAREQLRRPVGEVSISVLRASMEMAVQLNSWLSRYDLSLRW
ncbi:asparagine synthase (glutamine-hydrolyzing) [Actinoplanes teichomyceticus]|uniref:asparagine synthase (glutamine-hydrolyzing) n=1 Tax=Actinoplanes teichomyceticus TaxID=1867 RepID=A0A561WBS7_ACTTI|nr:asparagine synthase (glutamine-hydrolyzing) [Actinoplanes teichomyceticus]TWG21317.1 asparagine synthase (glutamine-hydrolysing) [Actinoplanes teichomyceticus]GIF16401.1 asparagine synthetase B [Actinoplanes teichomyceticus]